jgi:hypothetical protein
MKPLRAMLLLRPNPWSTLGLVFASGLALSSHAQSLLPNPGFEAGGDSPAGWRRPDHGATWSEQARQGKHALLVEGTGQDSQEWRTEPIALQPGGLYRLAFFAHRAADAGGGCVVSGTGHVNRDFHPGETWTACSFVFSVPHDGTDDYVRLGQWETKGRLFFDDAELLPVKVTHQKVARGVELGEGERMEKGNYQFHPNFAWRGANYHRPLHVNRAAFNSDRWCFSPGAELVYRFALPGLAQTNGRARVTVNYHTAGTLRIEASRDGRAWLPVAHCDGLRRTTNAALPSVLFPASEVFLRLSTPASPADLQVNALDYEAGLDKPVADAQGQTWFLAAQQSVPELGVRLKAVTPNAGPDSMSVELALTNRGTLPLKIAASLAASPGQRTVSDARTVSANGVASWDLTARVVRPGPITLETRVLDDTGRVLFAGTMDVMRSLLFDPRPGYPMKGGSLHGVWWCESGWKIGRDVQPPVRAEAPSPAVAVSAARGEYEAVQVVISPSTTSETTLRSSQVSPLRQKAGAGSPITVSLAEVAYVEVTRPTDSTCERGWYPDPLPPLRPLLKLHHHNLPIWLTVHVPREAAAGDYAGELELAFDTETIRVPLAVHVYDFDLPRETHLRSALGLGSGEINRYHKLIRPEDQQTVLENYLKNFAEHRISPYSFFDHAPIDIQFTGQGTNQQAKVDFAKFDAAAKRWLDEEKFNSFLLPLRGMGGGTFQSRHLGSLEGFQEGTPEFARLFADYLGQVTSHLRERGWLDKAYTYWFDEPDRKDYEFVVEGMKRVKAAAPGLKRMLTEQPEPELFGHVEIWCGLTPEWTPAKVAARRAAGDEVWWYICCGPTAPYATEFIDHPGTELRLWPWQSWQYGVQGILIWATTYWTSASAFPKSLQDPWGDPMSYVSGYDFQAGHVGYWGNGDGRFHYPPRRDPNTATAACLDEPVNSIRWEDLRDGMEDYEYFWLLQQEVKHAGLTARGRETLQQAERLLVVPDEISKDTTHFTTDPRLLLAHRDKVARMIEQLRRSR